MNQFKEVFLLVSEPATTRTCAASSAKNASAAGGKHNDLENVGWKSAAVTLSSKCSAIFPFGDYHL